MEEVEFGDFTVPLARLALHQNLPDERGDGRDGIRYGEQSHQRQAGVRQAGMDPLADRPDSRTPGERSASTA